jgi:hypothetical protein
VSVSEAASRVGEQVYHTGQGQDERTEASHPHAHAPGLGPALTRRGLEPATHTGSRERGGGLRQTLERQERQRERLTVERWDTTGTVWATPLEHRLPALSKAFAALQAPRGARWVSVAPTQATCCRGA